MKVGALNSFVSLMQLASRPSMTPYDAGYDCGLNGSNTVNCHFGIFSTPEQTREWERGKADGEKAKRR